MEIARLFTVMFQDHGSKDGVHISEKVHNFQCGEIYPCTNPRICYHSGRIPEVKISGVLQLYALY